MEKTGIVQKAVDLASCWISNNPRRRCWRWLCIIREQARV